MFGPLEAASGFSQIHSGGSQTACGRRPQRRRPSLGNDRRSPQSPPARRSSRSPASPEQSTWGHLGARGAARIESSRRRPPGAGCACGRRHARSDGGDPRPAGSAHHRVLATQFGFVVVRRPVPPVWRSGLLSRDRATQNRNLPTKSVINSSSSWRLLRHISQDLGVFAPETEVGPFCANTTVRLQLTAKLRFTQAHLETCTVCHGAAPSWHCRCQ